MAEITSTLFHLGHNRGASETQTLCSVTSVAGREGGDMQLNGGNKEKDMERFFSPCIPSLL